MRFKPQLSVLAGLLLSLSPAGATPANKTALGKHLGEFLPEAANSCATCHVGADPEGAKTLADFPHNVFGKRLAELGHGLQLSDRLEQIAGEDADGDGVSNLDELLAGSAPGNPDSTSKPDQQLLAAFGEFQRRYPWRPFEPVRRPTPPEIQNPKFELRSPIDAFIAAEHERLGLTPRPEAPKEVWLRRVHLDLTGLSPAPEERAAFLADNSSEAYASV